MVAEVARSCSVELHSDRFLGSGFFVRAGSVVTCAHVVKGLNVVTVKWAGNIFHADVGLVLPSTSPVSSEYWPFPDLAIIHLRGHSFDHPIAWLDPMPAISGDVLVAYGFS